ncbi:MAG TPA: hypothetical protein VFF67_03730 [Thermoplasmata archaeon]|nr:hypothetical protein [Thermoplasmata archaeon]
MRVPPRRLPPVLSELVLDASATSTRGVLESGPFLERYARWERRAGPPVENSGPVGPVLNLEGDRCSLVSGVGLGVPPFDTARTLEELSDTVVEVERATLDPESFDAPISTISFHDPPASLPDVRHAFVCPRCGQLELLHRVRDERAGLVYWRSHGCGVDLYTPEPLQLRFPA